MRPTHRILLPVFLLILTISSCRLTRFEPGKGYLLYSPDKHHFEVLKEFEIRVKEQKAIFGLIKFKHPADNLGDFIHQEIINWEGDAAIINSIDYQNDLIGTTFQVFRAGFLFKSRTIIIHGEVVKYK